MSYVARSLRLRSLLALTCAVWIASAGGSVLVAQPARAAHSTPVLVATIPIGTFPQFLAVNSVTNRIYVAHLVTNSVSVIDGNTNSLAAVIHVGAQPTGVAVNPATNRIYVASYAGNSVSVIDGVTHAVSTISTAGLSTAGPLLLAVNPVTNRVYAALGGCFFWPPGIPSGGAVAVIDGATNTVTSVLPTGGCAPTGVAINAATNRIYATNQTDGTVAVLDGATNALLTTIPVGDAPQQLAVNPTTNRIYVPVRNPSAVSVIDGTTNSVVGTIPVCCSPSGIAVNPSTNRIYVTNGIVVVIDGNTDSVVSPALISVAHGIDVNVASDRVYAVTGNSVVVIADAPNRPPVAQAGGPYDVDEGVTGFLAGSGTDPDSDPLSFSWDLDGNGTFETSGAAPSFGAANLDGPTTRTVVLEVCDPLGLCARSSAIINVTNVPPSVGPITATSEAVAVNTRVDISAPFADAATADTHVAVVDWGDGTTTSATVTESGGSGQASASHTYTAAGVYTLTLSVTDDDGESGAESYRYVVVYDASAGFVTGGGWIDSSAGSYPANTTLAGRATFGFVSRYRAAATPTGNTEFHFPAADLRFRGTTFEWLVIAGARAQCKGSGTINGLGDYGFLVTAIDSQQSGDGRMDGIRIRIWNRVTGEVVYDNEPGASDDAEPTTTIGGGSVAVH